MWGQGAASRTHKLGRRRRCPKCGCGTQLPEGHRRAASWAGPSVYPSLVEAVLKGPPGTASRSATIIDAGNASRTNRLEPIPLRLKALFVSFALAIVARDVAAQARSVPVVPGSRVRVKTVSLVAPLIANFLEQRGDTLVFIEEGRGRGLWSFDIAQIQKLEMTAGEVGRNTRPIARGAAIGAGIGLGLGILFAVVAEPSDSTKEYSKVLSGLAGAGVGAGVGAYFGSRVKTEGWVNIPLPRQLSLRVNRHGGLAIAIGLR